MPGQNTGGFDWRTLLSAVATMYPALEQAKTQRRQAEQLQLGQQSIARRQEEIDRSLGDEIAMTAEANPEQQRVEAMRDYDQSLQQIRARGNASEVAPSALGGAYKEARGSADKQSAQYGRDQAGYLSEIQGATRMREQAGQRRARLGAEISTAGRHAQMDDFLAQLRARQVQSNPYVDLLSGLARRIANNYEPGQRRAQMPAPAIPLVDPAMPVPGQPSNRGVA